jgi:hypothetical protein
LTGIALLLLVITWQHQSYAQRTGAVIRESDIRNLASSASRTLDLGAAQVERSNNVNLAKKNARVALAKAAEEIKLLEVRSIEVTRQRDVLSVENDELAGEKKVFAAGFFASFGANILALMGIVMKIPGWRRTWNKGAHGRPLAFFCLPESLPELTC